MDTNDPIKYWPWAVDLNTELYIRLYVTVLRSAIYNDLHL